MAKQQRYLKDKKISIWYGEKLGTSSLLTYRCIYEDVWAYYKYLSGDISISGTAIKVYDSTIRGLFVIGNKKDLWSSKYTLANLCILYDGKPWDIVSINDVEGYRDDMQITTQYMKNRYHEGMPLEE